MDEHATWSTNLEYTVWQRAATASSMALPRYQAHSCPEYKVRMGMTSWELFCMCGRLHLSHRAVECQAKKAKG